MPLLAAAGTLWPGHGARIIQEAKQGLLGLRDKVTASGGSGEARLTITGRVLCTLIYKFT